MWHICKISQTKDNELNYMENTRHITFEVDKRGMRAFENDVISFFNLLKKHVS